MDLLVSYQDTGVFSRLHRLTSGFRKSGSKESKTLVRITAWDLNTNTKMYFLSQYNYVIIMLFTQFISNKHFGSFELDDLFRTV